MEIHLLQSRNRLLIIRGTFVGFDIQNLSVLNTGLLNYITVTTYRDRVVKHLCPVYHYWGYEFLTADKRWFCFDSSVDEVKLSIHQPLN
jgi:hypothetical protein